MKDIYTSKSERERSPSTPRWGKQRSPSTPRWVPAEANKRPQVKVLGRNAQEEWITVGVKYTGKSNGPPPPLTFKEGNLQTMVGRNTAVHPSQGCKKLNRTTNEGKGMKEREQKRNEVVRSPPPPLRFVNWEIEKETGGPEKNLMPPPPLRFVNPSIRLERAQQGNSRMPLPPTREIGEESMGVEGNVGVKTGPNGRMDSVGRVEMENSNHRMENLEKDTRNNKNKQKRVGRGRQKYN